MSKYGTGSCVMNSDTRYGKPFANEMERTVESQDRIQAIAVDWSGDKDARNARSKYWVAEANKDTELTLKNGRTREELIAYLIEKTKRQRTIVVGLDFAFSFPGWFLKANCLMTGPELWECAEHEGEIWLKDCPPPFWGKIGKKKPTGRELFRETERELRKKEHQPKSPFQIAGRGAVGTDAIGERNS